MTRALVAYFSATGVTRGLSERLAASISADIREIVPEKPYTRADLSWTDKSSRSSVEMADRGCRPALKIWDDGIDGYDVVFIGFPIWWYREPSIIDTFVESYDMRGKKLVPFATSGGSGMGEVTSNLASLAKGAEVSEGRRFSASEKEGRLREWASAFI